MTRTVAQPFPPRAEGTSGAARAQNEPATRTSERRAAAASLDHGRRRIHGAHFWASRPTLTNATRAAGAGELDPPTMLYVCKSMRAATPPRPIHDSMGADPAASMAEEVSGTRPTLRAEARLRRALRIGASMALAMTLGAVLAMWHCRSAAAPAPAAVSVERARSALVVAATSTSPRTMVAGVVGALPANVTTSPPCASAAVPPPRATRSAEPARRFPQLAPRVTGRAAAGRAPAAVKTGRIVEKSRSAGNKVDRHALRPLPASCNPPYYYDRSFIKRLKHECL